MERPNGDCKFLLPKELEVMGLKKLRSKTEVYLLKYIRYSTVLKANVSIPNIKTEDMENYVSYIDSILSLLSDGARMFFEKEYFSQNVNKKWWIGFYSKTGFTLLKRNAFCEFLNYAMY